MIAEDVYNSSISSVYIDLVSVYAVDSDGELEILDYRLSDDTTVIPGKKYYTRSAQTPYVYTEVQSPTGNPHTNSYYESIPNAVHMNSCGTTVTFDDSVDINGAYTLFRRASYIPVMFSVTVPDTSSINTQSGSLDIEGVTSDYIARLQEQHYKLFMRVSLVKYSELSGNLFTLPPVDIEVSSISIDSKMGRLSISLKSGSILSYRASRYSYSSSNFPSLVR